MDMSSTADGIPQNGKAQLGVLEQRAIGQSIKPEQTHTTHSCQTRDCRDQTHSYRFGIRSRQRGSGVPFLDGPSSNTEARVLELVACRLSDTLLDSDDFSA